MNQDVHSHTNRTQNKRTFVIAPSQGLFLTCKGEKYIQPEYNNVQYRISRKAKSLFEVVAFGE
jgi:hypothetical protein